MTKSNEGASSSPETLVYDVPEAGRILGLNRNKAYAAAAAGEIPTIRFGKLLRVPKAAVDRLISESLQRFSQK
jgi:excisionase family DNA binding protein